MLKSAATMCAAVLLASTSSGALAQSMTWRISEAAGAVSVRHGAELRPAARNGVLAPGDAVVTGAGGRAVLVHDRDFVTVSANSRVTVPVAQEAGGFTQIVQDLGNAIFRIEKLKVPHFAVKTPYLAAVVKGTTFSVTVDGTGTSLQVVEGAVEVATLDGGAKDLIRPGTVATIGASDLFRLQVQGDSARTIDSPARAVDAPAAAPGVVLDVDCCTLPTAVATAGGAVRPDGDGCRGAGDVRCAACDAVVLAGDAAAKERSLPLPTSAEAGDGSNGGGGCWPTPSPLLRAAGDGNDDARGTVAMP